MTTALLGIALALVSAISWGSGDFSGGYATRRLNQFQAVALSGLTGLALLLALALARREPFPSANETLWIISAGIAGSLGLAALYRALSWGETAMVAPIAAVIGAALPVLFSLIILGLPKTTQLLGFFVALAGIWLVTRTPSTATTFSRHHLFLAVAAGLGFGGFFILLAQAHTSLVFSPLVIARLTMVGVALLFLLRSRVPFPNPRAHPVAILAGILDTGGNVFYLMATQFTRLDIAAVLASLYPAITVLLARLLLRERVSANQWQGVVLCLAAITLIAL
ncbi:MAG: DMT family transporter [Chloroflexi bacterium]|nr:MAG: DMT family transporter [Chloroflexota bacterium]